jgi:hypothetical protein
MHVSSDRMITYKYHLHFNNHDMFWLWHAHILNSERAQWFMHHNFNKHCHWTGRWCKCYTAEGICDGSFGSSDLTRTSDHRQTWWHIKVTCFFGIQLELKVCLLVVLYILIPCMIQCSVCTTVIIGSREVKTNDETRYRFVLHFNMILALLNLWGWFYPVWNAWYN